MNTDIKETARKVLKNEDKAKIASLTVRNRREFSQKCKNELLKLLKVN